jgi:hypothetical protein
MAMIIPPGGMAGFAQMTPASRLALTGVSAARSPARRRRKSTKKAARASRGRGTRKSNGKMKFGSPAWQKKYKVGKFAKRK